MNVLTGPVFMVAKGSDMRHVSLSDIMLGRAAGYRLTQGSPIREFCQLWMATSLVYLMLEGQDYDEDAFEEGVTKWNHAYNLFGDSGQPRFMQVEFKGDGATLQTPQEVRNFLLIDAPGASTKNPFAYRPSNRDGYCPACAAVDLFHFQMMCPGGGKGAGAPYSAGIMTSVAVPGDARETILANLKGYDFQEYSQDSNSKLVDGRSADKDSLGYTPSWLRPDFVNRLRVKSDGCGVDDPMLTRVVITTWMTRQVWLTPTHRESLCAVCGVSTSVSVDSITQQRRDTGGYMKSPDKVPSPYHPWKVYKNKGVDTVGPIAAGHGRISELLPVFDALLDENQAANVRKANGNTDLMVLVTTGKSGSFANAASHYIPLSLMGSADRARLVVRGMGTEHQDVLKNLEGAIYGAFGVDFKKKGGKKVSAKEAVKRARSVFNASAAAFPDYFTTVVSKGGTKFLPDRSAEWRKYLQAEARRIYAEVTESYAGSNVDRWKNLAVNYPFYNPDVVMSPKAANTPGSDLYDRYLKATATDTGIKPLVKRIQVDAYDFTEDADARLHRAGLVPSYQGNRNNIAMTLLISMPYGLKHKTGVSFGVGLRQACLRSGQKADNQKTRANYVLLSNSIYDFASRLRNLVVETGGVECDLNRLYWDLVRRSEQFHINGGELVQRWMCGLWSEPESKPTSAA